MERSGKYQGRGRRPQFEEVLQYVIEDPDVIDMGKVLENRKELEVRQSLPYQDYDLVAAEDDMQQMIRDVQYRGTLALMTSAPAPNVSDTAVSGDRAPPQSAAQAGAEEAQKSLASGSGVPRTAVRLAAPKQSAAAEHARRQGMPESHVRMMEGPEPGFDPLDVDDDETIRRVRDEASRLVDEKQPGLLAKAGNWLGGLAGTKAGYSAGQAVSATAPELNTYGRLAASALDADLSAYGAAEGAEAGSIMGPVGAAGGAALGAGLGGYLLPSLGNQLSRAGSAIKGELLSLSPWGQKGPEPQGSPVALNPLQREHDWGMHTGYGGMQDLEMVDSRGGLHEMDEGPLRGVARGDQRRPAAPNDYSGPPKYIPPSTGGGLLEGPQAPVGVPRIQQFEGQGRMPLPLGFGGGHGTSVTYPIYTPREGQPGYEGLLFGNAMNELDRGSMRPPLTRDINRPMNDLERAAHSMASGGMGFQGDHSTHDRNAWRSSGRSPAASEFSHTSSDYAAMQGELDELERQKGRLGNSAFASAEGSRAPSLEDKVRYPALTAVDALEEHEGKDFVRLTKELRSIASEWKDAKHDSQTIPNRPGETWHSGKYRPELATEREVVLRARLKELMAEARRMGDPIKQNAVAMMGVRGPYDDFMDFAKQLDGAMSQAGRSRGAPTVPANAGTHGVPTGAITSGSSSSRGRSSR